MKKATKPFWITRDNDGTVVFWKLGSLPYKERGVWDATIAVDCADNNVCEAVAESLLRCICGRIPRKGSKVKATLTWETEEQK